MGLGRVWTGLANGFGMVCTGAAWYVEPRKGWERLMGEVRTALVRSGKVRLAMDG